MVRQHHQLNGHEFEQTPGDTEGERSLVGYSPWGRKESDAEAEAPKLWPPDAKSQLNGKDLDARKD